MNALTEKRLELAAAFESGASRGCADAERAAKPVTNDCCRSGAAPLRVEYELHIPAAIERRISLLKDRTQAAIRARLGDVLNEARKDSNAPPPRQLGPPLRFYVEQYRIFYQLDPKGRRLVVLELRKAFA